MKIITTSWDDGHPLDFKLADLLAKYNLPATFYIPKTNPERPVMGENEIQNLAKDFEIGGHSLHHIRLPGLRNNSLKEEIEDCYDWLSQLLGKAPSSFCFPGGKYNEAALQMVFKSGFTLARTTELFSTSWPVKNGITATTLQAYPHTGFTYAKHLAKRRKWLRLVNWLKSVRETDLCRLTENHLEKIDVSGGCFHLWGHSWEIEKHNLWKPVESIFKILADRSDFLYVQNRCLIAPVVPSVTEPLLTSEKVRNE